MIEDHIAAPNNASENKIEKQIYTEIANYTKNARLIKLITAVTGLACFISSINDLNNVMNTIHGKSLAEIQNLELDFSTVTKALSAASLTGVAGSIIHRYTAGSNMKERHKQLILGS